MDGPSKDNKSSFDESKLKDRLFQYSLSVKEGDSDDGKGSVQTRHTETTFSGLDRKNYRQERTYN